MSFVVDIRHRLGTLALEASFESAGRLTALFGPSGSGKTSLVNIIGGLIRPDAGRVTVDGRTLVDRDKRVFVPKHRRRIGYVFQDARLFPHLTVRQNLSYGRFFTPAAERYADFGGVVELLGIAPLLDRRPNLLSGGEKQRVAIGRALVASPKLLLMDEPLASLDEGRKAEILPYLERLRDETKVPIVYVSHSLAEVARLATDVVMLSAGKVTAHGAMRDILGRLDLLPEDERSEGGAVIEAIVSRHNDAAGLTSLTSPAGEWLAPRIDAAIGSRLRLRIRARDVMIATERPRGVSALNIMPGVVRSVDSGSDQDAQVSIDCNGDRIVARITPHSVQALQLAPEREVFAIVKAVTFDKGNVPQAALRGPD
jgi:molybdate transport system ATP-binding protein